VLDHDERVAGIAQALHHTDDPLHVARMESDRGLIENEQCVDEGSAEGGREVDALHLAPREGARLAVEGEVAEPHVDQVAEAAADLRKQQLRGFIERPRQHELLEELAAARHRQQHQIVD